jgi:hypothetical protein
MAGMGLMLLGSNRLQLHKHANSVDDGRLAGPQLIHGRPNRCFHWLCLLLFPGVGVGVGDRLFDAC